MASESSLRDRIPDSVPDDIELFESGGDVYGRDEHGEFKLDPMCGAAEPQDGRCGAPCRYYMERYGEIRYCTAMPESTFIEDGSDFCKTHKSMDALIERAHELFKHGYFATNYVRFAEKLSTPKFLFAVEMVGGLFQMSDHEFDVETETRVLDAEESALIMEDSVEVELPIPTNDTLALQANELWTAACKEVMTQNMQEVVFDEGMATSTVSASADMEGQITDTISEGTEHHLHLPISRLAKDIKEHLKNGGVTIDDDSGETVTFQKNDYTLEVGPADEGAEAEDMTDVGHDFAKQLEADDGEVEVEVTE